MTDLTATDLEAEGWRARLFLTFEQVRGKTVLGANSHEGPLMVQRPFYPEGGRPCHAYILHPPGGVVGGDQLLLSVTVKPEAHALLTTPAAGKFYRSSGPLARLEQHLVVGPGAALEWLPQESIVYNRAQAHLTTRVELADDAFFCGWEILCLGLPAAGECFQEGRLIQDLEIWRAGEPIFLERGCYDGESQTLSARWGLAGQPVTGSLIATMGDQVLVDRIRDRTRDLAGPDLFAVTLVSGLVVSRYLGPDPNRAKKYFVRVWEVLRESLLKRPACPPRVWLT